MIDAAPNAPPGSSGGVEHTRLEGVSHFEQQLGELPAGAHLCVLYTTPAEQLQVLAAFFRTGLRRGERCLYLADAPTRRAVLDTLEAVGLDAHAAVPPGALDAFTARESYVRDGRFDPDAMLTFWLESAARATRDGWTGLRVAGEMSWVLGSDIDPSRLFAYEARLNDVAPSNGLRLLCQYDANRFPEAIVRAVLRTHPLAVIGERVHDNPYFEPHAAECDDQLTPSRVDWMLDHIQTRTRRAAAVADLGSWALERLAQSELMNAAAHLIWRETGARAVEVLAFANDGAVVTEAAIAGSSTLSSRVGLPVADVWPPLANTGGRDPLLILDWAHSPIPQPAGLHVRDITCSAAFPLRAGEGQPLLGVVWLHRAEQRMLTDDDIAFVHTVASMLSGAIARAHAERERDTLVGSSSDVIARFDRQLRHTAVNPALERLADLPAASLLGKTSREVGLIPDAHAATWERVLRLAWRTGREQILEFPVPTPSGDRQLQTRIIPELGPDGRSHALLAIARDVTEQRNAEAERRRLYPELLSQQARLTELIARLERDRARDQQLAVGALEVAQLTPRQREILSLLAKGWTNRRIAHELSVAPGTIKNQVARILAVLGAADRTEAAVRAVSMGLVEDDEPTRTGVDHSSAPSPRSG